VVTKNEHSSENENELGIIAPIHTYVHSHTERSLGCHSYLFIMKIIIFLNGYLTLFPFMLWFSAQLYSKFAHVAIGYS
jgi:hypothetical protein